MARAGNPGGRGRWLAIGTLTLTSLSSAASEFSRPPGWHFYQARPEATPAPLPTPEPERVPPPPVTVIPVPESPAKPEILSTEWLRQEYQAVLDAATENPTDENILKFLAINKVTLDRASRFTARTVEIKALNPVFSERANNNPTTSSGRLAKATLAHESMGRTVKKLLERMGIWYFFLPNCPYCQEQQKTFADLQFTYDLQVTAISLNGEPPPPEAPPKNWVADTGLAKALGVERTPTLFLVEPGSNKIVPLSEGYMSYNELLEGIVTSAHAAKMISDDEFRAATQRTDPRAADDIEQLLLRLYAQPQDIASNSDNEVGVPP